MTNYICYDNSEVIWGFGEDTVEALKSAADNISDSNCIRYGWDEIEERWGIKVVAASDKLVAEVMEYGGEIAWRRLRGVAVTIEEYEK